MKKTFVLDTNVLVSGLLSPLGSPGRIIDLVIEGEIMVFIDERIFYEYRDVLSRPELPLSKQEAMDLLGFILDNAVKVVAAPLKIKLPDPDDLMFIEVAVEARVDVIVTGNKRHFPKGKTGNIPVLSPSEFLEAMRTG